MNYDTWKSTDNVSDREDGIERMGLRLDEDERTARWEAMADWLKGGRASTLLRHFADLMEGQRDPYSIPEVVQRPILDFVEEEGWAGLLSCLARVMKETE